MPYRTRLRPLALIVCLALAVPLTAVSARADNAQTVRIDIPAGPLSTALARLAAQAGARLSLDAALVAGKTAPTVSGTMRLSVALDRLLAGSGLAARLEGDAIVMRRAPPVTGGSVVLPAVSVEARADRENAWGPVNGYVAQRGATATKSDTPLVETPQSVSVVGREEMESRAVRNISQATQYVPGVVTEMYGPSTRDDYFNVRGFESRQYLDGLGLLGLNYANLRIEPYGLERVEVLRGPASVLFGQNTPGGLVNMVSKRPGAAPVREIVVQAGNFDRLEGAFDLGGGLTDGVDYRLVGLARRSETQVDFSRDDRIFLAPSLHLQLGRDTRLTLLTHFQKDDAGNTMQFLPAEGTLLSNPNGRLPTGRFLGEPGFDGYERKQFSVGYELEHRVNAAWRLRQNLRYSHVESDYRMAYSNGLQGDLRTLDRIAARWRDDAGTWSVDNQAQADFSTGTARHTLLLGLDYRRSAGDRLASDSYDSGLGDFVPLPIDIFDPVYGQPLPVLEAYREDRQMQRQFGAYLQDQIAYGNWRITAGGRYDRARTRTEDRLYGSLVSQDDSAFSGRVGAAYLASNGLAPYASYATSFEPVAGTGFSGAPFDPSEGRQFEAGLRYQPTGAVFVALSAFDLRQTNVRTPDPSNPGYEIQTGEVTVRGIELEARRTWANGLSLIFSQSFQRPEITESEEPAELGQAPVGVPRTQTAVWLAYTLKSGPATGWGWSLGLRRQGATWGDSANTLKVPAFTLLDAGLGYDFGGSLAGTRFALYAQNLTDRRYVSSCDSGDTCYYGARRTLNASFAYAW